MRKIIVLSLALAGLLFISKAGYIHVKARLAQVLISNAWAETLETGKPAKPWPWADTWPVAKLSVPSAGINQYVLSGATGSPLAFGPGQHSGTVTPGEPGVSMIAGHRDTHFAFLEHIKLQQKVIIEDTTGQKHLYVITQQEVKDVRNGLLTIDVNSDHLLLVTCYPFHAINPGGPLRLLVTAEREVYDTHEKAIAF